MPYKPIRVVVEIGPNYIFHLLAVAKVGFDSEYSSRYLATVASEDLEYLAAKRTLLTFADGHMGPLVGLMIFLPCYLNLDKRAKLEEFFSLLLIALRDRHYQPFLSRYREEIARLDFWIQPIDSYWLEGHASHCDTVCRLADVYTRNFDTYLEYVWPEEEPKIQAVSARLNDFFIKADIISQWETLTKREFKFNYYEIVLCSAIANGPNANSLGYERNIFYSGLDFAFMKQLISHEVGTHILVDIIKQAFSQGTKYSFDLVYRTYENLAKFYNGLILGATNTYDCMYGGLGEQAQRMFRTLHGATPDLSPEELFWQAVERLEVSKR